MVSSYNSVDNWKKNFGILWSGQLVSMLSSAVLQMALIWHITAETKSALYLSLASIAGFLPNSIFGMFAGTLVDRMQRKPAMIIADLFIAAVSLVLVFAALDGHLSIWLIMVVLVLRSLGTAWHSPAISATTPLIVPEKYLVKCAGYTQCLHTIGYMAGTALAAVLYPLWNISGLVLLDVIGALIATACVIIIKVPKIDIHRKAQAKHLMRELKDGFGILKSDRGIFACLCTGTIFLILYSPVSVLFPLMSMDRFGGTTFHAAVAEMMFSAGMLLGGFLLGKWGGFKDRGFGLVFSVMLMGIPIFISGLLPGNGFWIFAAMCIIMGISGPCYTAPVTALIQQRIPQEYLGRAFGLYASLSSLAMPVGMAMSGIFADETGVRLWFVIAGAACMILAVVAYMTPAVRNIEQKEDIIR